MTKKKLSVAQAAYKLTNLFQLGITILSALEINDLQKGTGWGWQNFCTRKLQEIQDVLEQTSKSILKVLGLEYLEQAKKLIERQEMYGLDYLYRSFYRHCYLTYIRNRKFLKEEC